MNVASPRIRTASEGIVRTVAALCVVASTLGPAVAAFASKPTMVARLTPESLPAPVQTDLPRPLSHRDTTTYRRIFELQEEGRIAEANHLIGRLRNPLLMGHVLAQRYLHPTAYRSSYEELRSWLERYADHPDAERIYRLALRRRPAGAPEPKRPVSGYLAGAGQHGLSVTDALSDTELPSPSVAYRALLAELGELVASGRTKTALASLRDPVWRDAPRLDHDRARLLAARGAFFAGMDARAFELADAVALRSGEELPPSRWIAGLSAWRLGRYGRAAEHFAALARHEGVAEDVRAGAAYWAARANMVQGRGELAARFLRLAAASGRGFYTLLARATLGQPVGFDWRPSVVEGEIVSLLIRFPSSRRALALAQVGQLQRAEAEIRKLAARSRPRLLQALAALAESFDLPSAQMRVAQRLSQLDGSRHDLALYPAPEWEPEGGFSLDRALMFAFLRAETGFDSEARSHRGARGLMQIMPATAADVARRVGIPYRGPHDLDDPARNMAIGQAYLRTLLEHPLAGRSLVHLALAYNAGLGRLEGWQRRLERHADDPLLFIESIPVEESRIYIRKVLLNLWAYRVRFGQQPPSLIALAANEWPRYVPLDTVGGERHARADR